jgi:DNA invertase Pin-like site-specific DNA recombinase
VRSLRAGVLPDPGVHGEDRLVREPYELELLLRVFEDVGAQHLLTGEGEVTSEGVMHASISAEEIRKMKARHKRKQEDIAKDGRWGGGFCPFGYSVEHRPGDPKASNSGNVLEIDETEATLLRKAARRIIESGASAGSIAQEWNADG